MNKTTKKEDFIDFAYSPVDYEFKQRIVNPGKKKITFKGIRYLKELNEKEVKIQRNKSIF
jgi:hypothetical protein